jgi:hypothetical protein
MYKVKRLALAVVTAFSLILVSSPTAQAADTDVVINEIMYSPGSTNTGLEYIEFYNRGLTAVNMGGWVITDAVAYTFPGGTTIDPDGYLVVAVDVTAAESFYGIDVLGPFQGRLSNGADVVILQDNSIPKQVIDAVGYADDDPWPHEADGAGASLELIDPDASNASAGNWGIGQPFSPGEANAPMASDTGMVVITEIMYKPAKRRYNQAIDPINSGFFWKEGDDPDGQFVEILNTGPGAVDLSSWQITDGGGVLFEFDPGTSIDSGEFITVCENPLSVSDHYGIGPGVQVLGPFRNLGGLSDGGEIVTLVDELDRVMDTVPYRDDPPWQVGPDQLGVSLEVVDPLEPNHRADNWRTGSGLSGSAGGDIIGFTANNGSFENGDSGWSKTGNHAGTFHTTADSHDGTGAEHIVATGAGASSSNSLNRTVIGMSAGSTYTISMWVKRVSGTADLRFRLSGGAFLTTVTDNGNWQFVSATDAASSDRLYIFLNGAGEWLVDEIRAVGDGSVSIVTTPVPSNPSVGNEVFILGGTPGSPNSRAGVGLPPFVNRATMTHLPVRPRSSDTVTISAQVTGGGGVTAVMLDWEVFRPSYQSLDNGGSIVMGDDGTQGDLVPGDSIYTARISAQSSKSLVRYRVHTEGQNGLSETYPDSAEPNANRAYFVYNGENDTDLSAYFLIAPSSTLSTLSGNIWTRKFLEATLVVDGIVYDHIGVHYRGRGWRGHPKKSWRVDFNASEPLRNMSKLDLAMHFPVMQHTIHRLFFGVGQENLASEPVRLHVNNSLTGLYLAQESPNGSWLRARGMLGSGQVFKASGAPNYSQSGFNGSIVADLRYYTDQSTYPKIWEKKGDGLGSQASMIALTDVVDNTSSGAIAPALFNNMDVNAWLYHWAINVMGGNGDIIGTNYTTVLPGEIGAKWQMKSFDYSHFFGCQMLDFVDVICNPHTQSPYLYYNKFHNRVRTNVALENHFLAILKDVLDNYYTPTKLNAILDEAWDNTTADRANELSLGIGGPGPYVVSGGDLNEMKNYHANRRTWLLNTWIPSEGSASVANEHPTIQIIGLTPQDSDLLISWSADDEEGDPSTVDLFWYDKLWSYFEPIPDAVNLPSTDGNFVWVAPTVDFNERDIYIKATIRDNTATYDLVGHTISNAPVLGAGSVDTTPPAIVSARRDRNVLTTIEVEFSEALDATTASTEGNYSMSNGASILNASASGGDTVVLTISPGLEEQGVVLTINNVGDLVGNPITPGSQIGISVPLDIDGPPAEGLTLWLAADEGVSASGSNVTGWSDISDGRNNGTPVGSPQLVNIEFPAGVRQAIRFDGSSGFDLANTADLDLSAITIYAVMRTNASNSSRIVIANYRDVVGFGLGISDTTSRRVKWFTSQPVNSMEPSSATLNVGDFVTLEANFSGGRKELYVDQQFTGGAVGTGLTYGVGNQLTVGYLKGNRQFLVGDIAEILVYDSVDTDQSETVHAYLQEKYFLEPQNLTQFRRGDVDGNGFLNTADAVNSLIFQFVGTFEPTCLDALDTDDDGRIDIADPLANLFFQFRGAPNIPAPGPFACGFDLTEDSGAPGDDLGCGTGCE